MLVFFNDSLPLLCIDFETFLVVGDPPSLQFQMTRVHFYLLLLYVEPAARLVLVQCHRTLLSFCMLSLLRPAGL